MVEIDERVKFGRLPDGVEYRQRPGAYAVIFDGNGKFAAVKGRTKMFLPGGGIEAGESPEETLAREVREECAREVFINRFLGSAIQYFTDRHNGSHWEFHCNYFEAQFGAPLDNEPEHELVWLEITEAHVLAFEVHAWAVNLLADVNLNRHR
ncbi:MAG: NUDIX domain-containing protein [Blastocatellales bacterium]